MKVGDRFGLWTIVKLNVKWTKDGWYHLCRCDCGTERLVYKYSLSRGLSKSCSCVATYIKEHNLGRSEYNAWCNMKRRCYEKSNSRYSTYGGRGVRVCNRWIDSLGFINFMNDMGAKPTKDHTLERIDNDKNYSPENCIWLHKSLQAKNKTTSRVIEFNGEIHILEEWGEITGLGKKLIWSRLNSGWSVEEALTKPVGGRR